MVKEKACKRACLQALWRRVRDSNPRFLVGTRHFECRTFDLSDNSPCVFQSAFFFAQISVKKFLERKAGEKTKKYSIFDFENPYISRFSGGRNGRSFQKFRVIPVMTTSKTLPISYAHLSYHISPPHATTYFFLPRQNTNRNRGGILSKIGSFCRWISSQQNFIRQFDYLPKSQ